MEKASLILLVVIVLELGWWCEGCLKEESIALLRIKKSFYFPTTDTSYAALSNWGRTADCCSWYGISCDTTTGHVADIDLPYVNWDFPSDRPISPHFYLNASLFLPFQNLNRLNLQGNGIVGCFKNEGFEKLSGLANLEFLDLSYNAFNMSTSTNGSFDIVGGENNNILSSLKGLSSLKHLNLCGNLLLNGSIDMKELDGLSNLEELCLGGNIDRFAFSKDIMSLQNLSYLDLEDFRGNNGNGTGIKIESLGYVKSLGLGVNNLDAIIFPQDESEMKSLESLSLRSQSGSTKFLETIGGLTSLKTLSIWGCGMRGRIPSRQGNSRA